MAHIKSTLLFGVLFFFFQTSLHAQLPSGLYKGKEPLKTNLQMLRQRLNGFSIMGGIQQTNFLNPVFANNLGTGYERNYGYYLGGRVTLYPFFLDIENHKNYFTARNIPGVTSGENIGHIGWDFSMSTALMPYGKLAKFLNPYFGIGYQKSSLCVHCVQTEDDPDDLEVPFYAVGTSSSFWKTGIAVSYKRFRVEAEFKQTASLKNNYALNAWRIGLGWKPGFKSLK